MSKPKCFIFFETFFNSLPNKTKNNPVEAFEILQTHIVESQAVW